MFDHALCLCHFNEFGLFDILDDVPKEDEYPTEPNDPNAQHDTF